MKTLLLIDADANRSTWLGAGLEMRGFLLLGIVDSLEAAINNITRCHPNVVLIAPKVAKISGASITRTIMESYPVPIVLLTDAKNSFSDDDANWCGATATAPVPNAPGDSLHATQMTELAHKVKLMSEVPVVKRRSSGSTTHPAARKHVAEQKMARLSMTPISNFGHKVPQFGTDTNSKAFTAPVPINTASPPTLIGISSSTGGPVVIQKILADLPANFPIPIVVIQHLTKGFSDTLIKWLDSSLQLKVFEARHGETVRPGCVYVVSGQMHAVISSGLKLQLIAREVYPGHCPSGTVFLNSMAALLGPQALGIVLTGMGNDGSEGLLAIRSKGGLTYAQEESTCTMASMPHEAIAIGAASYVLTPESIGAQLQRYCLSPKYHF